LEKEDERKFNSCSSSPMHYMYFLFSHLVLIFLRLEIIKLCVLTDKKMEINTI